MGEITIILKKMRSAIRIGSLGELIRKHPQSLMIVTIGIGIVLAGISTLFKSPGVEFVLEIKTHGFELRTAQRTLIRDVIAKRMTVSDGKATWVNTSNSSGQEETDLSNTGVKLDSLMVPEGTHMVATLSRRDAEMSLVLEAAKHQSANIEISVISVQGQNEAVTSKLLSAKWMSIFAEQPKTDLNSIIPFRISGLTLAQRDLSTQGAYPVSLVQSGQIQFYALQDPVDVYPIKNGQMLYFSDLNAEISSFWVNPDSISLRILGTASEVRVGYGTQIHSIYPNAFQALRAQPLLVMVITTLFGIALALLGSSAATKDDH